MKLILILFSAGLLGCGKTDHSLPVVVTDDKKESNSPVTTSIAETEDIVKISKNLAPLPPKISLLESSRKGYTDAVKQHIAAGSFLNDRDKDGNTPLHEAAAKGHFDIVTILIKAGANINAVSDNEYTPLLKSVNIGHIEITRFLLKAGSDVNAQNNYGETPLHISSKKGDIEIIRLLLEAGANINTKTHFTKTTPLLESVNIGHIEITRLLLKAESDVNAQDNFGKTPLRISSNKGHIEITRLLLEAGANIEDTLLLASSYEGHIEITRLLLEAVKDVNVKNAHGYTPLHLAAFRGNDELGELLILKGANINAKSKDGDTPLHQAAFQGNSEVSELLILKGAKINEENINGLTPLDKAIERNKIDTIKILQKYSARTGTVVNKKKAIDNSNLATKDLPKTDNTKQKLNLKPSYPDYDERLLASIKNRWEQINRIGGREVGRVVITFTLWENGDVSDVEVEQNTGSRLYSLKCERAVQEPAPYDPWPAEMKVKIGDNKRFLRFTFESEKNGKRKLETNKM